ncbi:hypothetical protein RIF29_13616 [Crotalaria pallida]|uniref:Transmembrane protein n=1 Tax=Crotalaria pallida TaxID=3830 RepID=A0AAN9IPH6_CROPI
MAAAIISRKLRLTTTTTTTSTLLLKSCPLYTFSHSKTTPPSFPFPIPTPQTFISPTTSSFFQFNPNLFFSTNHSPNSNPNPNSDSDSDSDSNSDSDSKPQEDQSQNPSQNPTMERDQTPLGNETREVLETTMKGMQNLSKAVALLALIQLGLGVWITLAPMTEVVSVLQSITAFAFPSSLALMLRRALKPMNFLKMEAVEMLQIMTQAMEVAKQMDVLFGRVVRGGSFASVAIGLLYVLFSR